MTLEKIKSPLMTNANSARSVDRARAQNDTPEVLGGEKLRNVILPSEFAVRVAEGENIQRQGVATDLSKVLIASRSK
jgi:hypothetical protein